MNESVDEEYFMKLIIIITCSPFSVLILI